MNTKHKLTAEISGRRGRPPKGEAAKIKEEIVLAATSLFLSKGYEETSTDEVAAVAACSKRTLYSRFPKKADLFEAVVSSFVQSRMDKGEADVPLHQTLSQRLHRRAQLIVETMSQPDVLHLHFLLQRESGRFPELVTIAHEAGRKLALSNIQRMLETAGMPSAENDFEYLAETFYNLIIAPILQRAEIGQSESRADAQERARRSVEFFLRGSGMQGLTEKL